MEAHNEGVSFALALLSALTEEEIRAYLDSRGLEWVPD